MRAAVRTLDRVLPVVAVCCVVAALAVWFLRSPRAADAYVPPPQVLDGWRGLTEGGLAVGARPDAPVQLVVFTDYECPFCRAFEGSLGAFERSLGDSVAVTVRPLPLPSHRAGLALALGAFCADDQGAFAAYHAEAFRATGEAARQAEPDTTAFAPGTVAARSGVQDAARFEACLRAPETRTRLQRNAQEASRLGFPGVPTVVVNGVVASGDLTADSLASLVRYARRATLPATPQATPQAAG